MCKAKWKSDAPCSDHCGEPLSQHPMMCGLHHKVDTWSGGHWPHLPCHRGRKEVSGNQSGPSIFGVSWLAEVGKWPKLNRGSLVRCAEPGRGWGDFPCETSSLQIGGWTSWCCWDGSELDDENYFKHILNIALWILVITYFSIALCILVITEWEARISVVCSFCFLPSPLSRWRNHGWTWWSHLSPITGNHYFDSAFIQILLVPTMPPPRQKKKLLT